MYAYTHSGALTVPAGTTARSRHDSAAGHKWQAKSAMYHDRQTEIYDSQAAVLFRRTIRVLPLDVYCDSAHLFPLRIPEL